MSPDPRDAGGAARLRGPGFLRSLCYAPISPRVARCIGRWLGVPNATVLPPLASLSCILVVRLDAIGDVVLTTPLLRTLRRNAPKARITLLVRPGVVNLVETCPYVDEVLTFDPDARGCLPRRYLQFARSLRFGHTVLRARHFDLALAPRRDVDLLGATHLMYFSSAPVRVGSSDDATPEKFRWNRGYATLLTHPVTPDAPCHDVTFGLKMLRDLGATVEDERLELWPTPSDLAAAATALAGPEPRGGWVALAPGANHPRRCWPIDRFRDVAQKLSQETGCGVVVVGGRQDQSLGHILAEGPGQVLDLTGRLSLRETAAVLARCRLLVSNDSGPLHLGVAMKTPVIMISCHPRHGDPDHAHAPTRFGPWRSPSRVLQPEQPSSPCRTACEADHAHCICAITPDQVREASLQLLASPGSDGV